MNPVIPDLSVQVTRRRTRCVVDPNLALSRYGATVTRLMAPYAEQWVGPEIFNVLDSAHVYRREPELLIWPNNDDDDVAAVPEVLLDWMRLREEAARCLYWVGDALRESNLPEDLDDAVLVRWEAASRTLDCLLPRAVEATGPLVAAMRDAAALCAVLPNACIIGRGRQGGPPAICEHLRQWGLACTKLDPKDALVSLERAEFRRLLVAAGLAPLIWAGLQLAVVHLAVPFAGRLEPAPGIDPDAEPTLLSEEPQPALPGLFWGGVTCQWYNVV